MTAIQAATLIVNTVYKWATGVTEDLPPAKLVLFMEAFNRLYGAPQYSGNNAALARVFLRRNWQWYREIWGAGHVNPLAAEAAEQPSADAWGEWPFGDEPENGG